MSLMMTFQTAPWNEPIPCNNNNNKDELDLVTLVSSDEFKARLRALLEKYYRKVFSMRLREEPALLEPMSIDVDVKQWQVPANQRGPRLLTDKRQEDMRRHIENMLKQKIIQPSKAPAFSQILLIPRTDGNTRFCMDLRALNKIHLIEGWPIPNIELATLT